MASKSVLVNGNNKFYIFSLVNVEKVNINSPDNLLSTVLVFYTTLTARTIIYIGKFRFYIYRPVFSKMIARKRFSSFESFVIG